MTDTEQNEAPKVRTPLEEIESLHPWSIYAFLGAWLYLLLTYWF